VQAHPGVVTAGQRAEFRAEFLHPCLHRTAGNEIRRYLTSTP
jgi:hypothetical protein